MPNRTKKQKYAEFCKKARDRDFSWSLLFLKAGQTIDEIGMPGDPNQHPEYRDAAIQEFQNKHKVQIWSQLADNYKDFKVDGG